MGHGVLGERFFLEHDNGLGDGLCSDGLGDGLGLEDLDGFGLISLRSGGGDFQLPIPWP
jgi:hypothetical protein